MTTVCAFVNYNNLQLTRTSVTTYNIIYFSLEIVTFIIHINDCPYQFPSNIFGGFVNYKKGALDPKPQVISFTSCLPMVGGSLRVLWLLPPLKLVAMI